jgi:hypothetical protein
MCTAYFKQEYIRRGFKPGTPLFHATKATPMRWAEAAAFGLLWAATCYYMVQGSWIAMLLTGVTGWLFCCNYWHGEDYWYYASRPRD